jgi:hypothetical protein
MKVLFLDIDSVLNTVYSSITDTFSPAFSANHVIHAEKLALITDFCSVNNINIVITSDWRRSPKLRSWLTKLFGQYNCKISFTGESTSRELEIFNWIKDNSVIQFAVLDDIYLSLPNFVHVDHKIGLTEENVKSISKLLL